MMQHVFPDTTMAGLTVVKMLILFNRLCGVLTQFTGTERRTTLVQHIPIADRYRKN